METSRSRRWLVPDTFFALRPTLWFPVWTLILAGMKAQGVFAVPGGRRWAVGIGLSAFMGAVYLHNQLNDEQSDAANEKLPYLRAGVLTRDIALRILIGLYILGVAGLAAAGAWLPLGVAACLVLITALLYNLGGRAWKDQPIPGILTTAIAGAGLWLLGAWFRQPASFEWWNAAGYGCAFAAVGILTGIPDAAGDRAADKKTLAVWLGAGNAARVALLLLLAGLFFAWRGGETLLVVSAGLSLPLFIWAAIKGRTRAVLAAVKGSVLLLSVLVAMRWYPYYFLWMAACYLVARMYHKARFQRDYPSFTLTD